MDTDTMKKLILLLIPILPILAQAEGPQFEHKEPIIQREYDNVYKDLRNYGLSIETNETEISSHTSRVFVSSNTTTDGSTASTSFVQTPIGVSFALSNANNSVAVICTGEIRNNTANGSVTAALFRDSTNLDDTSNGQATAIADGNTDMGNMTILGHDTPGDTSTHLYAVYIKTNGTGTAHYGDGATGRCLAWETP